MVTVAKCPFILTALCALPCIGSSICKNTIVAKWVTSNNCHMTLLQLAGTMSCDHIGSCPTPPGLVNWSAKVTVLSLEQFQAEYNQQQWVSGDW